MSRTRTKILLLLALLSLILAILYRPQPLRQSPYSLIELGLYLGGKTRAPPPGTGAVLCLTLTKDDYTTPNYQWSPIPDAAPAPSLDWLREQVTFIDTQRRAGNDVFVHCDLGSSRSPMVVAAYLMWHHHWPRDRALAFLSAARPIISPNPAFLDLLHQWEQSLPNRQ